jgi:hypothetical protein
VAGGRRPEIGIGGCVDPELPVCSPSRAWKTRILARSPRTTSSPCELTIVHFIGNESVLVLCHEIIPYQIVNLTDKGQKLIEFKQK